MSLPNEIPTVRVTGTYKGPDGRALKGTITFTGPPLLTFAESDLFVAGPVAVSLDEAGQIIDADGNIGVHLPATDAPNMNPTGWTYTVKENLTGVTGARTYSMVLPQNTLNNSLDLADVAPADPTTPTYVAVEGPSAYEVAVAEGFTGTEDQWLASLVGPQGPQGLQGVKGDTGAQGPQGLKGDKGDPGLVQSVNGKSAADITLSAADVDAVANNGGYSLMTGMLHVIYAGATADAFKVSNADQSKYTAVNKNAELVTTATATLPDLKVGGSGATFGGGSGGVIAFANASVPPTTNPVGAALYAQAGTLKVRQSDGTVVTVGAGGGSGTITSVNGDTGPAVVLDAADVGALASTSRGAASGVAELDSASRLPISRVPTALPKNTWTPQALGFEAWSVDPGGVANPVAKYLTPQRLYVVGFNITEPTTVNRIVMFARGYGGVTTNRYRAGIYRESGTGTGTKVVESASVALTMAGQETGTLPDMKTNHIGAVPITIASTTLQPGRYWVVWDLVTGGAADFSFFHVQNEAPLATANFFMTDSPWARAWYLADQTTLPTTLNQASAAALANHDIPIMALANI